MGTTAGFQVHHALLLLLCYAFKLSQQQSSANANVPRSSSAGILPATIATPSAGINVTRTRMPMHLYENLPTVTIATPSAWVNRSASIPTNLATDRIVVTSASVGGLPRIYLGASIAAKAHAAVQLNCSRENSPDCQSSVKNAIHTDNALEVRFEPIELALFAAVALIAYVLAANRLEDANLQPQRIDFQSQAYTQLVSVQSSNSVVLVTASNDPNPVIVPLRTAPSGIASTTPTGSVYISTATADGLGYFSGDSVINVPTVDVAPLQSILAATQSGALCASPSVHIINPLQNRDSYINWGAAVGPSVEIWKDVALGGDLQLLRTAQDLHFAPLVPALVQAAQQVVNLGQQVTQLFIPSTGLITVATVLLIITAVTQNCLVAWGNSFLIPKEAFADKAPPANTFSAANTSTPSPTSAANCAPTEYQPFCINCGGNAGSSKCSGIKTKSYTYSGCPCYEASVYKYIPDFQQIALAAQTTTPDVDDISVGNITCQTTTGSPDSGDIDAVITQLQSWGLTKTCLQGNSYGSHCSTIISNGTAAISICGSPGATNYCYKVAQWAQDIEDTCLDDGRAGGQNIFDSTRGEVRVELIHASVAPTPIPKPIHGLAID